MDRTLLQATDLTVRYGDKLALDHANLEIAAGETLALVGPSGSGKSTLARALLRLHPLESGFIQFENEDWLALKGSKLRKRRALMQMVFQDPLSAFNPRATVHD
ncbi:MAG: ATP-binding cassette domain-containing protein, partial [Brucella pseudogrignonensis]